MKQKLHADILILGAGIGGYEVYRTLNKLLRRRQLNQIITIVDRDNYFTFAPLLHEVASGSVEPSHCAIPLREIVYKTPHQFIKAEALKIDPKKKIVATSEGNVSYDYCVVGLGSGVNFFGVPGAAQYSHTIRTLAGAARLHETIIEKLEDTRNITAITVVGGGLSGVEVAGQLAHLIKRDFKKLYPGDIVTINLVELGSTLATQTPPKAQRSIIRRLTKMGVRLHFKTAVKEVAADTIVLKDGSRMPSDITVWCAGIENAAARYLPEDYCERGRLPVTACLTSPKATTLYGVGDIILGRNAGSDTPYPPLGEAAHVQGKYIARHIISRLRNKKIKPFYFKSKGTLMPIGERYGVAIFGNVVLTGLIAWWLRRAVYIIFMPGLIFKFKLTLNWTLRLFGFNDIITIEQNKKN